MQDGGKFWCCVRPSPSPTNYAQNTRALTKVHLPSNGHNDTNDGYHDHVDDDMMMVIYDAPFA